MRRRAWQRRRMLPTPAGGSDASPSQPRGVSREANRWLSQLCSSFVIVAATAGVMPPLPHPL